VDLPQYVSEPLGRSPLVLVAAQVNFEEIGQDVSHDQARQIQKLVGAEWVLTETDPHDFSWANPFSPRINLIF